jgi:lysophospholipase L1-like esterase
MFLIPLFLLVQADPPKKSDFSRWEKAIAAFEKQDQTNPPRQNGIVFTGSSTIAGWKLPRSFPMLDAVNRGFGGSQLADAVHFAPRIVTKYRPRAVVLYSGDNDIASGRTPEQVASDFREFVQVVQKELPKTKIIFLSIKPSIARWKLWEKMKQANKLIAEQCAKDERLIYLDVSPPMLGEDGKPKPELFAPDGLHLSEKGYEVWSSLLKPHLPR